MRNLLLIALLVSCAVFGFTFKAFAAEPGCTSAGPYNIITGNLCTSTPNSNEVNCPTGDLYSRTTGERCTSWTGNVPVTTQTYISAPLSITTSKELPSVTIGSTYSTEIYVSGGTGKYVWSIVSGSLPRGVDIEASLQALPCVKSPCIARSFVSVKGTAVVLGAYDFRLSVVSGPKRVVKDFTLRVVR